MLALDLPLNQSYNSLELRALELLGSGLPSNVVAASCGISESRISQLLSNDAFAAEVTKKKYENLNKIKELDDSYDRIESKLITKLEASISHIYKPNDLLRAIQVINQAKRKAPSVLNSDSSLERSTIVELSIPQKVVNKFITNINQQVVQIGQASLVTLPTNQLDSLLNQSQKPKEITHDSNST